MERILGKLSLEELRTILVSPNFAFQVQNEIENRIIVQETVKRALVKAACTGDLSAIKALKLDFSTLSDEVINPIVQSGGEKGLTPLHVAAKYGHLETIKFIVPKLQDKNPIEENGNNYPLNLAAIYGHLDVVEYLHQFVEGHINPPGHMGRTVLHDAAQNGHLEIVKFYTSKLDNPNPKQAYRNQYRGHTPLHDAAQWGHLEVAKHLCGLIQDRNPSDDNGYTPLHSAAQFGRLHIVKYLVQFIEDKHPKSGPFWNFATPLDRAIKYDRKSVVDFLTNL